MIFVILAAGVALDGLASYQHLRIVDLVVALIACMLLGAGLGARWQEFPNNAWRLLGVSLTSQQLVIAYGCYEAYRSDVPGGTRLILLLLTLIAIVGAATLTVLVDQPPSPGQSEQL